MISIPWVTTRKSNKPEKHLKPLQACLLVCLLALIHYVPRCKIYGTQKKAQRWNSASCRALPPPCTTRVLEVMRGLGARAPSWLLRARGRWLGEEPVHTSGAHSLWWLHSASLTSIHNRGQRATKTGQSFVGVFSVTHWSVAPPPPPRVVLRWH